MEDRPIDRQTDRQTDRQNNRQTGRYAETERIESHNQVDSLGTQTQTVAERQTQTAFDSRGCTRGER